MFPNERWGKNPQALDLELIVLDEAVRSGDPGLWRPAAMAVVEVITGVRLDGPDPNAPRLLLDETIPEDPRPPSALGRVDPDLDVRLRLAPAQVHLTVLHWAISEFMKATGLDDEPIVRKALERMASGQRGGQASSDLVPLLAELAKGWRDADGELRPDDHPLSCRFWAASALETALTPPGVYGIDPLDALAAAPTILGEAWHPLRRQIKTMLDT
ncbi:hypothetical protein GCM10009555_062610 [Acrocarpospora macrocephala]|uniref:Uncharacterized protein n=1 Tax=Acrocarpospora macrocephala TaxID=150177 RepID=A0A5M3WFQ7_9ACTN|nr:hypothetical protein [Acrocarpospora macrocephala]GES07804.1 hypothetical protein Amac_013990 [Acrocarpospora macrocephala]